MKRVALLLAGSMCPNIKQEGIYKECFEQNTRYIINDCHPDIFLCTNPNSYPNVLDELLDIYKPIKYTTVSTEEDKEIVIKTGLKNNPISRADRIIGKLYKEYQVGLLKQKYEQENNFKYDIVIRTRPDMWCSESVSWFFDFVKSNIICIPNGHDYLGGVNDTFAIATSKDIDIYNDLYNHIIDLNTETPFHPERTLRQWLVNKNNLILRRINLSTYLRGYRNTNPFVQYIDDKNPLV